FEKLWGFGLMAQAPLRRMTSAAQVAREAPLAAGAQVPCGLQVRTGVQSRRRDRLLLVLALFGAMSAWGCSELRGRRLIQKANQLYRDGQYKEAVAVFREAEQLVPDYWMLWLNLGYTCQQMVIPGAKTPENDSATQCALQAFRRLQTLKPSDP